MDNPMLQIRVLTPSQTLELVDESGFVTQRYLISTSAFGLGTEPGSNRTPTGRFVICEKIGQGAPAGEIFVGRIPTGRFGTEEDTADHVQTRILWLDGQESENSNTKARYIYIHGTNAEKLLGTPASHGCVRMSNSDVMDLFDRVDVGTPVFIQQ
jgi:lipoprotein-anchoring transpeptidase ErfK/SrfK